MSRSVNLELWIGPATSGKTRAAIAEYRRILSTGNVLQRRRALWLAPTVAAVNDIRDRLMTAGQPDAGPRTAILDIGVATFADFAAETVWNVGLRFRAISALERRRLLRIVIDEAAAAGELQYFGAAATSPGLVKLAEDAIARLKRQSVSAEAHARRNRRAPPRLRELALLYARYERRLSESTLLDAEGMLLAARDGLRSAGAVGSGLELVVVDGFSDLSAVQTDILKIVATRARRVVVTLPGEPPGVHRRDDLFARSRATCDALASLGARIVTAPFGEPPGDRSLAQSEPEIDSWPAMQHLERNLFRDFHEIEPLTAEAAESLDRIEIVAASGVQAEIEEIARRCKRWLLAGAAPDDIVVTFRSIGDLADRIRQVFADFGVPLFLDARQPLASTPLVRSLLGLLQLHLEDWPYRRLLRVIGDSSLALLPEGPPTSWPAGGDVSAPRRAAELCIRQAQLPQGRGELLAQVQNWAAADDAGSVDRATAHAAGGLLGQLAAWLDLLPGPAPLETWVERIEQLADAAGLLDDASRRAAWDSLSAALRAVHRVEQTATAGFGPRSLAHVVELVAAVAAETSIADKSDPIGHVRVLPAEAARFVRPRHLILGGLSEQAFVAHGETETLGESESALSPSSPPSQQREGEMLLFYQVATRPTESLTLCYPALDAKGQPMPASPFLLELERAFPGASLARTVQSLGYTATHEGPPLSQSELRRAAVQQALQRKRQLLAAMSRSPRRQEVGHAILDGVEAVARRTDRKTFGEFEGVFNSDGGRAILERRFGPERLWSPSLLETYAACPFRFFAEQVIKLQPLPDMALQSDLARRGSLLHDTLAKLYARLSVEAEAGQTPPTPAAVAEMFQRTLDAVVRMRPQFGLQAALREIERRQIASWAQHFAEQHQNYLAAWQQLDGPPVATYFEARFGPKSRRSESEDDDTLSTSLPFDVLVGDETMHFIGQIDRIDIGRVGDRTVFNVIDYKTSDRAKVNRGEMEAGRQLQLPLYVMAAAEMLLRDAQAAPLAAGYWSIRGNGFGMDARSPGPLFVSDVGPGGPRLSDDWMTLRQALLGRIGQIVAGIRRGWFPVSSHDKECTKYCDFSTTCRIAHLRSLEKTWSPPGESS